MIYPTYRLVVFGIVAVALLALYLLLYRTRLGMVVRAGIEDAAWSICSASTSSASSCWCSASAPWRPGFAGIINAPDHLDHPRCRRDILIECFVVVVIGGVGSFPGRHPRRHRRRRDHVSLTSMFDPAIPRSCCSPS